MDTKKYLQFEQAQGTLKAKQRQKLQEIPKRFPNLFNGDTDILAPIYLPLLELNMGILYMEKLMDLCLSCRKNYAQT